MYAVIKTGGKQYRVSKGDVVEIERIPGEAGALCTFDEVLLLGDEETTEMGRPLVEGAAVEAQVVEQARRRKILIFKMRRRKNYRRRGGHRQNVTRVRITDIKRAAG